MDKFRLTACVLALCVGATSAMSASDENRRIDRSEPKSITREAALEKVGAKFDRADENGDGVLTGAEVKDYYKSGHKNAKKRHDASTLFDKLDADQNSVLSVEEMAEFSKKHGRKPDEDRLKKHFERLDADSSGGLSLEEFKEGAKHRKGKKGDKGKARLDSDKSK